MKLRSISLSGIFAALILALPASAEDLALIISNTAYRSQSDLPTGPAVDRMERALKGAGFATVTFENQRRAAMSARLREVAARIKGADRLVVVANGHVVHSPREIWLLGTQAARPSAYDVGAMAVPLGPLFDAAAEKPGGAVIIVPDQIADAAVAIGIIAGAGPIDAPQGVTVLQGSAGELAKYVVTVLTVPGEPIEKGLASHAGVRASGFVPVHSAFLPAPAAPLVSDPEPEPEPEPTLSREQILANIEADLELSRANRRKVQQSLAILGHDPGGIDGLIGRGSRRAIRAWQTANQLEATGYLNRGQYELLLEQGEARSEELEEEARQKQAEEEARDRAFWRDMGSGESEEGMRAYLRRYPDGLFSETAKERLAEIEEARRPPVSDREQRDWDRAVEADTVGAYRTYLDAYPEGAFASEAQFRLDALEASSYTESQIRAFEAEERRVAGAAVTRRLVENRLAALGLEPGNVDGEFDEDTRRALRRFQDARGLEPTGYVNQATLVRVLLGN